LPAGIHIPAREAVKSRNPALVSLRIHQCF
jgi:hypothetical protein